MEPTSHQPSGSHTGSATHSHGTTAHSDQTSPVDPHFSTTAAHATGDNPTSTGEASQPAADGLKGKLDSAVASGKKWLSDSGIADQTQQLPAKAKELGNKAVAGVSGLTTTQKAVGVGLLAAGIAFLLTRGKGKKEQAPEYRDKPRKSPFDHQPHTKDGDYAYDRKGQRPWGNSRYSSTPAPTNKARVQSGSGYGVADNGTLSAPKRPQAASSAAGQRRDQGPASGSKYDVNTSGSQNPNNLDQLNSAY